MFLLYGLAMVVAGNVHAQTVTVSLPEVYADVGEQITIAVSVGDLTGLGVRGYQGQIQFDPAVILLQSASIGGTVSAGGALNAAVSDLDQDVAKLGFAYAKGSSLVGGGTLFNITATVQGEGSSQLTFSSFQFSNDQFQQGQPPSTTVDGFFSTEVPAEADVSIDLSASHEILQIGETLTLSARVSNAGPDAAADVETEVALATGSVFASATGGCAYDAAGHSVTCTTSTLGAGSSVTYDVDVIAPPVAGEITFSGSVSASSTDPDPSNDADSVAITTTTAGNGIPDDVQDAVPNRDGEGFGDGNGDGIPDSQQEHVASLPNAMDGSYVTIESPDGTQLRNVQVSEPPAEGTPPNATFPDGLLQFVVTGVSEGGSTTVTIYTTQEVNSYFKFGPTPENTEPHWYEFVYDGTTGAEILEDRIVLHFVDGERGDADLDANGEIMDPGAPAIKLSLPPGKPLIASPAPGATFVVGGASGQDPEAGSAELFAVVWNAVEDADSDSVGYRVEIGADTNFETVIESFETGTETELSVSVAQGATWFDTIHGETELGATASLYIRVVASDGELETASDAVATSLTRGTIVGTVAADELPDAFVLHGNYPNPFNPSTRIAFDLPQSALVSVEVFDVLGKSVMTVPARSFEAGAARGLEIDAGRLPSGAYLYRVTAEMAEGTGIHTGIMTLMK